MIISHRRLPKGVRQVSMYCVGNVFVIIKTLRNCPPGTATKSCYFFGSVGGVTADHHGEIHFSEDACLRSTHFKIFATYFLVSEPEAVSHIRMVLSSAQLISCLLSGVYITFIRKHRSFLNYFFR
jgi:hypothetical protein